MNERLGLVLAEAQRRREELGFYSVTLCFCERLRWLRPEVALRYQLDTNASSLTPFCESFCLKELK